MCFNYFSNWIRQCRQINLKAIVVNLFSNIDNVIFVLVQFILSVCFRTLYTTTLRYIHRLYHTYALSLKLPDTRKFTLLGFGFV